MAPATNKDLDFRFLLDLYFTDFKLQEVTVAEVLKEHRFRQRQLEELEVERKALNKIFDEKLAILTVKEKELNQISIQWKTAVAEIRKNQCNVLVPCQKSLNALIKLGFGTDFLKEPVMRQNSVRTGVVPSPSPSMHVENLAKILCGMNTARAVYEELKLELSEVRRRLNGLQSAKKECKRISKNLRLDFYQERLDNALVKLMDLIYELNNAYTGLRKYTGLRVPDDDYHRNLINNILESGFQFRHTFIDIPFCHDFKTLEDDDLEEDDEPETPRSEGEDSDVEDN